MTRPPRVRPGTAGVEQAVTDRQRDRLLPSLQCPCEPMDVPARIMVAIPPVEPGEGTWVANQNSAQPQPAAPPAGLLPGPLQVRADTLIEIFDLSDEPVLLVGDAGRIVWANRAARLLVGGGTLVGRNPDLLFEPEDLAHLPGSPDAGVSRLFAAILTQGQISREARLRHTADADQGDGSAVVMIRGQLLNNAPQGTAAALFLRDLTQQRRREQALLRSRAHAEELAQARWDFLATMSHELRTPLSSIMVYTDSMLSGLVGFIRNPTLERYLQLIHRSGEHMLALTNDILDYSKCEANKATLCEEQFDIGVLCEDAMAMVEGQAEESRLTIRMINHVPGLHLFADRLRLSQVVINLIGNAIKFTPAGGTVTVEMRRPDRTGPVEIIVRDTGIGIAAKDLPYIFEPFAQFGRSQRHDLPGTGLGLPLTRKLVEMHNGSIAVRSEESVGTTVVVSLPAGRVVAS